MSSTPSLKRAALKSGRGSRPGFSSSLEDVAHGGHAELLVGELLGLERRAAASASPISSLHRLAALLEDALDHRIGLRVHRRCVERVVAVADAQEAGALLEGLGAQAAAPSSSCLRLRKAPLRVAPAHDVLGHASTTGPTRASAARADAVLRSTPTAFTQSSTTASSVRASSLWFDVVLVLADADRLGIDLHQLGQRILQAARDRHRAAQGHVEVGNSFAANSDAEYTEAPASLTTTFCIFELGRELDQVGGQLVGLAAGGAVADRDQVRRRASRTARASVCSDPSQSLARLVRIDGGGVDQLAGARRPPPPSRRCGCPGRGPSRRAWAGRRGQQQVAQVVGEDLDRHRLRPPRAAARTGRAPGAGDSLTFQVQATHLRQQVVGRRGPAWLQPRWTRDAAFGERGWPASASVARAPAWRPGSPARGRGTRASARCDGTLPMRLGVVEVVAELGAGRSPCLRPRARGTGRLVHSQSRSSPTSAASSAQRSDRMSRTPSSAALASATPFSASTKPAALLRRRASGRRTGLSASGSRPASRAICALVRRLGLYGRYRSSSSCLLSARLDARRAARRVSLPCSSMLFSTAARRSSSSRR